MLALMLSVWAGVAAPGPAPDGTVNLPLDTWVDLVREATDPPPEPPAPPEAFALVERDLEGTFRRGLLEAQLTVRLVVRDTGGHVRVPIVDRAASLGEVLLDGEATSLTQEGEWYTLGLDAPGTYELKVQLYRGREQERFARRVQLSLPPGGVTRVALTVPEADVRAALHGGALVESVTTGEATRLVGHLAARSGLDLTWTRRGAQEKVPVRVEARLRTLLSVGEALVTGVAAVDTHVLEGETDRVALRLPEGLEVLDVEGDAVLQWRSDRDAEGDRLTVLLRYLVADKVGLRVRFQFPVAAGADGKVALVTPLPITDGGYTGVLGVQAPAALDVSVESASGVRALEPRELPPELTRLTTSPLVVGFTLEDGDAPKIDVRVQRKEQVELITTLVDDLQASTVLLADGTEVTKVRMELRNNTQQYLALRLPEGSELTQALLDGRPVRPAEGALADGGPALLFPLRQSERTEDGVVRHEVVPGETLGDIANFYFADPNRWMAIVEANRDQLSDHGFVRVGQVLRIPSEEGVAVAESSFGLELAYRRQGEPLEEIGGETVQLPRLDVDVMRVTWHLYLPDALTPLEFDANLQSYTALRYDPFRRFIDFLHRAMGGGEAQAGGYESILERRKAIYEDEAVRKSHGDVVGTTFPLVGLRYRFKRVLPSSEPPTISVYWVSASVISGIHWGSFGLVFLLVFVALLPKRRWIYSAAGWLVALAGVGGLMVVAHYVLGVHRRILWGVDLALLAAIIKLRGVPRFETLRSVAWSPWRLPRELRLRHVIMAIGVYGICELLLAFPTLIWLIAFVVLAVAWRRAVYVASRPPLPPGSAEPLAPSPGAPSLSRTALASLVLIVPLMMAPSALAQGEELHPREDNANRQFDSLMAPWTRTEQPETPSDGSDLVSDQHGATIEVPLERFQALWDTLRERGQVQPKRQGPAVVLGASRYMGRALAGEGGTLAIDLELDVELGREGVWKTIPLVGDDTVMVSATVGDAPIPVLTRGGYHVWTTQRTGEVTVKVRFLAPSRGPRGSIEYDFIVARTPVTRVDLGFGEAGLEPRLSAAVRQEVEPSSEGGTQLSAVLRPTTRVHIVGFRDLGEQTRRPARVYADTMNLLSVDEAALELFSVIRYTILYAGAKTFEVAIPEGFTVVSASGEGGFDWRLDEDRHVLVGETAAPIRDAYEISMRLRRDAPASGDAFDAPLPKALGAEREVGWLAVEVPGKLRLDESSRDQILSIDTRQLPPALIRSAVSPILKAYRYHTDGRRVALSATRLPEVEPRTASIDRVRAFTVVSPEGDVLTDLRITLRNRVRHHLALVLPEGTEVRSALLDGRPVKPSREGDRVMLPLMRSAGRARLAAFTLQVILAGETDAFGWVGRPELTLPTLDLPVLSMQWSVFLPGRHEYGELTGDVPSQSHWGTLFWQRADDEPAYVAPAPELLAGEQVAADAGAMPIRVKLPKAGVRLDYTRWWVAGGQPVTVRFSYAKGFLRVPAALLLGALLLLGLVFLTLRGRWRRYLGALMAAAALWPLAELAGTLGVLLSGGAALLVIVAVHGLVPQAVGRLGEWARTLPKRFAERQRLWSGFSDRRTYWWAALVLAVGYSSYLAASSAWQVMGRLVE